MTEREEREYEALRTVDDYLDLIEKLDDGAQNLSNDGALDKSMFRVAKALDEKIKYVVKLSKRWRKRQGLLSRARDRMTEAQQLTQEHLEAIKELQKGITLPDKLLLQYTPKKGFLKRLKGLFQHKQTKALPEPESGNAQQNSSSQAPPEAEDPSPKVEDEQDEEKNVEVVEDNQDEVDDESPEDDDVLDF